MKAVSFILVLIVLIFAISSDVDSSAADLEPDSQRMMETIRELSQNPRGVNNAEIEIAREFIISELRSLGLAVKEHVFEFETFDASAFEPSWLLEFEGDIYDMNPPWIRMSEAVNIIATIPPNSDAASDDILLITAHYDTVDDVPGANDNGSGVAVVLELARLLANAETDTEIRFIFFDVEEIGLIGAINYVLDKSDYEIDRTIGVLNFDMLAGAEAGNVKVFSSNGETNFMFDILRSSREFSHVELSRQTIGASDHMAFHPVLIPGLLFSHEIIWEQFHNYNDIIDHLCADMLVYAATAGLTIIREIISDETPSFIGEARPVPDETIFNFPVDVQLPINQSRAAVRAATGINLTQVRGDTTRDVFYEAKVRMFDMPEVLTLRGISHMTGGGAIIRFIVNMQEAGVTVERLNRVMAERFGEPVIEHRDGFYIRIWNNGHGNTYEIVYMGGEFDFSIGAHINLFDDRQLIRDDIMYYFMVANELFGDSGDEPSPWAVVQVVQAALQGVLPEVMKGDFQSCITREDFSVLLYNILVPKVYLPSGDVPGSMFEDTARNEVLVLSSLGILSGRTLTNFEPNANITRQEAAAVLSRSLALLGWMVHPAEHIFEDEADIADYALIAVKTMLKAEVMIGMGDNRFYPLDYMTREQAIVSIMRMLTVR